MSYKVTKTPIPKKILNDVRKEYNRIGSNQLLKKAILEDMKAGVSPVRGAKWKKYSDSYKSVIRGEKTFRTVKIDGQNVVKARNGRDESFFSLAAIGGRKGISPVNLKLTGELYKSLKVNTIGRKIVVAFNDFLALVHNNLGAGKSKAIRRLLPTESGEKFNDKITQVVEAQIKKAVDIVVNFYNRQ